MLCSMKKSFISVEPEFVKAPEMLKFAAAHRRLWSTLVRVTIMSQLPCSQALRKSCVWLAWVASVYPTKPTREIEPLVSVDNDLMWRTQNLRNAWGSTVEGNRGRCKDVITSVMVPQLKSIGLPITVARPGFPVSFGVCMHHLHCHSLWPSSAELCWQLPHQALSHCPAGEHEGDRGFSDHRQCSTGSKDAGDAPWEAATPAVACVYEAEGAV